MSDPIIAPHPHPKTMQFTRVQITIALIALLVTAGWGAANYFKPTGQTSTVNGPISGGVGINNGTINNNLLPTAPSEPRVRIPDGESKPPPSPVTSPTSSPASVLPLNPKQKETKLAAWRKFNRQMEDFSAILKRGDEMLDGWLADTQSDPHGEASKVRQFAGEVYNMRLALEADHNTMTGDQAEVGTLVKEAVRPPGAERGPGSSIFRQFAEAADALANDMASSRNYDRQNLEDRITATAQAVRKNIDTLKNRQKQWSAAAPAQIRALSE